jgi:hypothetical protein
MRNNKLSGPEGAIFGKWNWQIPFKIGMILFPILLDEANEPQAMFVLREDSGFIKRLQSHGPIQLHVGSGLVNTSKGPVGFLLAWFPPLTDGQPFASYEMMVSPQSDHFSQSALRMAAEQSHIHLMILDEQEEIIDVVEFENVYGFELLINACAEQARRLTGYSFTEARDAFFAEVPQMALWAQVRDHKSPA